MSLFGPKWFDSTAGFRPEGPLPMETDDNGHDEPDPPGAPDCDEDEGAVRYTDDVSKRLDCVLMVSGSPAPTTVLWTESASCPEELEVVTVDFDDDAGWFNS